MFERFTRDARDVVRRAEREAATLGSPVIEAEHLLLALTEVPAVGKALGEAGLDHDALVSALEIELATALEAVGVRLADFGPPPAAAVAARARFGTSAKAALERAVKVAAARRDRRLGAGHVALAVLAADRGTVPRALAAAGVDVRSVRDRVAATM